MATRRENKFIQETLLKIARRYNVAYQKLLKEVPALVESYYSKSDGFYDIQEEMNKLLEPINQFAQLEDYNHFYTKVYRDAIRQANLDYKFSYNFNQVDQRALETFRSPQNWFVSKYQTLTDQGKTLSKMEELWQSGESIENAVKELDKIFTNSQARINAYTQTTLITNNTRIRSTADLNNFSENDITKYIYRAVVDNVTTETCKDLNGKTYSIKKALDFQRKTDEDINNIIQSGQRKGKADWQIYNDTVKYLQKNDALTNRTGTAKRPWQTTTILRTADPQKQGKETVKSYKNIDSVPGNKLPRPPLHFNCRSRIEPVI